MNVPPPPPLTLRRFARPSFFNRCSRYVMNVFTNTVVTLTFELYDSEGTLLESTDEPIAYLHGGHSGMLPKLEEALNLKKVGDAVSVDVEPVDARSEERRVGK